MKVIRLQANGGAVKGKPTINIQQGRKKNKTIIKSIIFLGMLMIWNDVCNCRELNMTRDFCVTFIPLLRPTANISPETFSVWKFIYKVLENGSIRNDFL